MSKGTYTNAELVDSIIVDLNNMVQCQMTGQYIQACTVINHMSQKLISLRTTIDNDLKGKDEVIESLKETIRNLGGECIDQGIDEFLKGEE